ncbi:hypothetical protein RR46_02157 [Papilio xuthus]|uniref:Uncharacterized protein n=1 Tax=Papilio xuthus TaxID=66420 RepID=A0A194QPW2_PAPXU|nr:hypothetical protein RR46_02157 [Papilio xuthus]
MNVFNNTVVVGSGQWAAGELVLHSRRAHNSIDGLVGIEDDDLMTLSAGHNTTPRYELATCATFISGTLSGGRYVTEACCAAVPLAPAARRSECERDARCCIKFDLIL